MKNSFVRKLLVGVVTLTMFFSAAGNSVSYAVEQWGTYTEDEYMSDSDAPQSEDESDAEETSEAASGSGLEQGQENQGPGSGGDDQTPVEEQNNDDGSASEATTAEDGSGGEDSAIEASTENPADESSAESSDSEEQADEASSDSSEEASGESSEESSEAASEASSSDEADFASSEASDDPVSGKNSKKSNDNSIEAGSNDLSNKDFGYVYNLVLPTNIENLGEKITLKFDFHVYHADKIPNGQFTYTLPTKLDFSAIEGTEIKVFHGGTQIGKAVVTSDGVITFSIDENYLSTQPNGLDGHVELECMVDLEGGEEDEPIKIIFSDGTTIEITVNETTITATKAPVDIKDGIAPFKVVFTVHAKAKEFTVTDTLGSNLTFVEGSWSFYESGSRKAVSCKFDLTDEHTLNVNVGDIAAGTYILAYKAKAVNNFSTKGRTTEEIIEMGNGNTATWKWKGISKEQDVVAYATSGTHYWINKIGNNGEENGAVGLDGKTEWTIYINGGGAPMNMAGVTLKDVLDPGMVFDTENIVIRKSYDMKTWTDAFKLSSSNFGVDENGAHYFTFTFPENAPVAYYSIRYKTRIDGELPTDRKAYTNRAYLSLGETALGEDEAHNTYRHVGAFQAEIDKELNAQRDSETGKVSWKTVFYINGTRASYDVKLTDIIDPYDENRTILGKHVAARIVKDSVKLYSADETGNPVSAVSDVKVEYKDNTYVLTVRKLAPGKYVVLYETQDYIGSENVHSFPEGSSVKFKNRARLTIDSQDFEDEADYEVTTDGLPMQKQAFAGDYDSEEGTFAIPWKIFVNRNELGQTNKQIANKSRSVVTDYLPDKLVYKKNSAEFIRPDGTTFKLEPTISAGDNGSTILKWEFEWEKGDGIEEYSNYYVLSFISLIDKAYFEEIKNQNGDGVIEVSFDNDVFGDVGSNKGGTNTSSHDEFQFLSKKAEFNDDTQLVEYTVTINREGFDLIDNSDVLKLKDDLVNGTFVTGSLKVYYLESGAEYVVPDGDLTTVNGGRSFVINLPDKTPLVVKYSVKPDVKAAEGGNGTTAEVSVSNTATLYGDGNKSSEWKRKYTVDTVTADITSEIGEVKVTKVDARNTFKGLDGCEIGLYKVDIETGEETLVDKQITAASDFCALFNKDGKYKSLIFDTLYYYKEIKAPKGYELDDTKNYFIFIGSAYSQVENSVKAYVKDAPFTPIDIKESGSLYEFYLMDYPKQLPPPEEPPVPPDDPPVTPDDPPVTPPTTPIDPPEAPVAIVQQPEVLGARRTEVSQQAVLGARRGMTADRDMTASYVILFAALASLFGTLFNYKKDKDIDENKH